MKLTVLLAQFFQPSMDCIVKGSKQTLNKRIVRVNYLLLQVELNIVRPENTCVFFKLLLILFKKLLQKQSCFGFYLDHLGSIRVSKFTYGSFIRIAYD